MVLRTTQNSDLESIRKVVARMTCHTKLWAVNANWNDDGWNLNANSVENPNDWNADNLIFSRYSRLSPPSHYGGVFLYHFFSPATNHLSDSFDFCAKRQILIVGHQAIFPQQLNEKSHVVYFHDGNFQQRYFLFCFGKCRSTECCQKVQKCIIYSRTQTEAFRTRNFPVYDNPSGVERFYFFDNR